MVRLSSQQNRWSTFGDFDQVTIGELIPNDLCGYLTGGLSGIVSAAFMRAETQELIDDTYAHLQAYLLTVILSKSGLAVAFMASDNLADAMYLKGIIVAPEYQGHGIGRILVGNGMDILSMKNLGLHTQNANMDLVANSTATYVHKSALSNAKTFGTKNPVVKVIGGRERVVHESKYGGQSLYGDLNHYLQQNMAPPGLDYQSGDALFFYGTRRK